MPFLCSVSFFSTNGIVSAQCSNARDCLEVQYKVNNVLVLTKKPNTRSHAVKVEVLCQHQFSRLKCMDTWAGARGSPMSQQGHTLWTPGTVIMHCKQLRWEKACCDRPDRDHMSTCVEKRIVFIDPMCKKLFFFYLDLCSHDMFTKVNNLFLFM